MQGDEHSEKSSGRLTHASRIYSELRRDILFGKVAPGIKLKTLALSDRFGVGLSPLREALNRLASEGLIVQTDRRGFSVAPISQAELDDITNTRVWIHGAALKASMENGGADWEEELLLSFHRLARTPRTEAGSDTDCDEWIDLHRRFHMALLSGCGSVWMMRACEQMFEVGERYRMLGTLVPEARANAQDEHRAIMDAAIERRTDEAVGLLSAHYRKTQGHLRAIMQSLSGADA